MIEPKTILETAKVTGVGEVAKAAYGDALSPAAKELGNGLEVIAKVVTRSLFPLETAVWGFDRIREYLCPRITGILAERRVKAGDIQSPPVSVAGPLIMQMLFASEEPDLREMYAKLLATSMDRSNSDKAHPSFVTLIQQLTPGEARILHHLASQKDDWPCWESVPKVHSLQSDMREMCTEAGVTDLEQADLAVENLLRLRILHHITGSEAEYFPEGCNDYGDYGPSVENHHAEFIELTAYGKAFLEACVIDACIQMNVPR